MAQLIQIMLQAGVLTREQAEAALQHQVLFGDRIGTNLIASRAVSEATVAQALGAVHQVPHAAGLQATTRAAFTRGLHRSVAQSLRAVPARIDEHEAAVFMTEPHDQAARAQLEELLGRRVQPIVVCEARMWALLHKFYMVRRARRVLTLDGDDSTPRRRIVARSESRRTFSTQEQELEIIDRAEQPPTPAAFPTFLASLFSEPVAFRPVDDGMLLADLAPAEEEAVVHGTLIKTRDTTPLALAEAQRRLATAFDRDEIALIVLRYCRSLFRRALLLTVQGDVASGWDAVGDGLEEIDVKGIHLPLVDHPSIFKLARDTRGHFLGPLPREKVNILFLKLTGAQIPKSALIVPILVRGSVVNLLYCDNGKGEQVTTEIGDMLVIAQHINRSYEALLADRGRAPSALAPPQ